MNYFRLLNARILLALLLLSMVSYSAENQVMAVKFSDDKKGNMFIPAVQPDVSPPIPVPLISVATVPEKGNDRSEVPGIDPDTLSAVPFQWHTNGKREVIPATAVVEYERDNVALRQAIELAVKWHPQIKRAERELEQSQEYIKEAQAAYYPSLKAGVKSGFEENQYTGERDRANALVLSANQMIYDFGKTQSKFQLAKSAMSGVSRKLHKDINDIIYETIQDYLQTVRYRLLVEAGVRQVAGFRAITEIAEKRSGLGASAESDYSQAKVRMASSIALQHDYDAQARRWAAALDNVTNHPVSARLTLNFPSNLMNACSAFNDHSAVSPAVAIAEAQIAIAKEQLSQAQAEYYPTISLNPSYEYQLDSANSSRNGAKPRKGLWGVFVNVNIPIYEGGAQVARARQSEQALYAAQFNRDNEKKEARRRISEATSQVSSIKESLEAKRVREEEARKTRDLYKLQYVELGNRSFSDLLSAESEIHQTRMDIINGTFTMATLSIECLYYSGRLSEFYNIR